MHTVISKCGKLNYTAIALSALRRLPPQLVYQLKEAGEWQDILHWCNVAAVESINEEYDLKQCYNAAQRQIYQGLKNAWYKRQSKKHGSAMQYQNHHISYESIQDDDMLLHQLEVLS